MVEASQSLPFHLLNQSFAEGGVWLRNISRCLMCMMIACTGEACIVFMVQDMSSSESSGLLAFAALAGSAVNQDGRSSALTAPNGPSQQAVIMKVSVCTSFERIFWLAVWSNGCISSSYAFLAPVLLIPPIMCRHGQRRNNHWRDWSA